MSRRRSSWTSSYWLIAGAVGLTGCGEGPVPPESPALQARSHALTYGPDLRITELKAPESARPGDPILVTAKVCNTGTDPANPSGSNLLQVYLSTTPTQQVPLPGSPPPPPTAQMTLGEVDVGPVGAGQCVSRSLSVPATPPSGFMGNGAYYLGASIDTGRRVVESDESNNGFVRGLLGVGLRADLVVTRLDGPPSLSPGQSFTATATVCNVGTEAASFGSVELHLSTVNSLSLPTGPTPPPTQFRVAGQDFNSLLAGACRPVTLSGFAHPPPAATPNVPLYLGAIVDASNTVLELRDDNNILLGGLVGFGQGPDLVIRSVTGPASVRPGAPFTASVTVCNEGTMQSISSDVAVLLSSVPSLGAPGTMPRPTTEVMVANVNAPPLVAGQCVTRAATGFASPPPVPVPFEQPLYLGAIVDLPRNQMELREDNNVRADFLMGVGTKPDLIITSLTAPAHVAPGQSFTANARVCNVGTEPSQNVPVELYLSTEPTLAVVQGAPPPGRVPAGMFQAPGLAPGECALRSISAWAVVPPLAPMPNPTLYVGALVDPQASHLELREDNNASPVSRIGVAQGPDLVVRSVLTTPSARPGTSFQTSVQVCNEGTTSVTSMTTMGLFLSTEPDFTLAFPGMPPPTVVRVGSANVIPLGQGQCTTVPSTAQAQLPPEFVPGRPLYLGAVADVSFGLTELREDNNVRTAPMSVGNGPDLAVREVAGPKSVLPGAPLTLVVTVCNMGVDLAPPTQVMAVLTPDATLSVGVPNPGTSTDAVVGMASTPSLGSGQCSAVNVAGYANPPPGADPEAPRFLGARVDFSQQVMELREDNNTLVGPRVGMGSGPDLVVRTLSAPASIPGGSPFTAQVKVCNEGTAALSGTVPVDLIISSEPVAYVPGQGSPPYTQLQLPVGNQPVSSLGVNQCTTLSIPAYASRPSSPGTAFYLGAIVDAPGSRWELREDNNSFMLPTPTVMP